MDFWSRFERGLGPAHRGMPALDPVEQGKVKAYGMTDDNIRYVTKVLTRTYEGGIQRTPLDDNIGTTVGIAHNVLKKPLHPKIVAKIRRAHVEKVLRDMRAETPEWAGATEPEKELFEEEMIRRFGNKAQLPPDWKKGDPMLLASVDLRLGLTPDYIWEELYDIDVDDARGIGKRFIMGTLKENDENRKKQKVQVGEEVWDSLPWHHKVVLGDMGFQIGEEGELGGMIGFQKARQAFIAGHAFLAAREMLWNGPGKPTGYVQETEARAYNNAHIAVFGYPWPGRWEKNEKEPHKPKAPQALKDFFSHENLTRLHAEDPRAEGKAALSPQATSPNPSPQAAGTQPSMWLGVP